MWIEFLKVNFKEIVNVLSHKPFILWLIATTFAAGYFMQKYTQSKDDNAKEIRMMRHTIDSLNGVVYDRLYELNKEKELNDFERRYMDSIIREKLLESSNKIKK